MNREHVVQIGFSFDEDKIVQTMTESCKKKLEEEVRKRVRDELTGNSYYEQNRIDMLVGEYLKEIKDEVIERTTELLVEKLYRTKAVKEMVKKVGDEL